MVRPMVHSTKHYVQFSVATAAAGTQDVLSIVKSVAVGAKNLPNEIEEGSSIKACFVELWLRSSEVSPGSFVFVLAKLPGGSSFFDTAGMAGMNDEPNKKNVLFMSQGLVNDQDADAVAVVRGWYKIPKSKQRFGLGDELVMQIFAQGAIDVIHCGFATYKEYS